MAAPEEYLLRFDLERLRSQVDGVRRTYTEFGSSLKDLISATSDELSTVQQRATATSGTLAGLGPQIERSSHSIRLGMGATAGMLESLSQHSEKIANDVTRLSGIKLRPLVSEPTSPTLDKAMAKLEIAKETAFVAEDASAAARTRSDSASKQIKATDRASAQEVGRIQAYLQSELDATKSKVKGVLSHVPGGVLSAGGVMGGLIGAMVLGYTETDRLRAQSGEILNVFEATGESFSTKASKRVRGFFSGFQETAQWFYKISKEETQGVLKSMVDAGFRSKDFMTTYDKTLGFVGKNVTIASIALDKHFNQQTGTSMKNVITITRDLGDTLDTATDKYVKLAFAGQRSAMGISRFVDAVISGASAMQQYGVDVSNVASVMETVRKHYEDMGLDPRYAGGQAEQVIGGMAQGMASLSPSMKAVLAQQMFPEMNALDALQRWEDGFLRVGEEGGNDFMQRAFVEFQKWATAGGRGRSQAIRIMEMQGLDNRTAATVHDLGEKLAKSNELKDLSTKEEKSLRGAFQTEQQKVSQLHRTQRNLYIAIKFIGQGLLKILVGLVGVIASGLKAIPSIIQAALSKDLGTGLKELERISNDLGLLQSHMGAGVDDIIKGVRKGAGAISQEFADDLQPLQTVLGGGASQAKSGGIGVPGSVREAMEVFKGLGGTFSDLYNDPDFRRQAMEHMQNTMGGIGSAATGLAEDLGGSPDGDLGAGDVAKAALSALIPGGINYARGSLGGNAAPAPASPPPEDEGSPGPASAPINVKREQKPGLQQSIMDAEGANSDKTVLESYDVVTSMQEASEKVSSHPNG